MSRLSMADLITPERIRPSVKAASKRGVISAISRLASGLVGVDRREIEHAILAREDLTTFGVGRGIALPHAAVRGLSRPFGAFVRLTKPVDFGAADGRPADLVLLVLAPAGDEGSLLRALSCAARRMRDREVAENLRAATSAEAACLVLTTDAWRGAAPVAPGSAARPAPPAAPSGLVPEDRTAGASGGMH